MDRHEALTLNFIDPDKCAKCPRRSIAGKTLARILLGSEYSAPDCDQTTIIEDGNLKNELFDKGLVDSPSGIRATPAFQDSVANGAQGLFMHPRQFSVNFRFGINDQICPKDITV